jgi:glycosyltransferase involved in cell wall biosynthesis
LLSLLLRDLFLAPPLSHVSALPSFLASLGSRTPVATHVITRKPMVPALVSIVIPCFNYQQYLGKAICSAQAQQYRPIEIIVVDDGSTDDSAAVAEHAGVRLIRQRNAGLGAARNAGLAETAGEFVLFLDADDELLPDAVATGVAVLQARPALSCVVRLCQVMDAQGRDLPAQHRDIDAEELYREWLHANFVWTPGAAVFRRDRIAEIGGFPAELGPASDYAVYLALARASEVAFDPREVVRYRQHDRNMSLDPVLMLRAVLGVLRRERTRAPHVYHSDLRVSRRSWREYYSEQIIQRLRRDWRTGGLGWWHTSAVWTLSRHTPSLMFRQIRIKLSRVLRGNAPAPLERGRFNSDVSEPAAKSMRG